MPPLCSEFRTLLCFSFPHRSLWCEIKSKHDNVRSHGGGGGQGNYLVDRWHCELLELKGIWWKGWLEAHE